MSMQLGSFLEALDGIAYLTDPEGTITAVGRRNWNAFAAANGGAGLVDGAGVIGTSLFDCIVGASVNETYRAWFAALRSGRCDRARISARCDAPGVRRRLMISMTPIRAQSVIEGILVQSVTIGEEARPPLALFDFSRQQARTAAGPDLPIVALCSFCQDVRYPPDSSDETGSWIGAEEYYRRGGESDVRISHGICPSCFERSGVELSTAA